MTKPQGYFKLSPGFYSDLITTQRVPNLLTLLLGNMNEKTTRELVYMGATEEKANAVMQKQVEELVASGWTQTGTGSASSLYESRTYAGLRHVGAVA